LNAKNFFATTKPEFSQQRYGASLGGPLVRNRTHFFGAYEYSNVDTARIIALPAVNPFAARENGIFPSGSTNHMADMKLDHRFSDRHGLVTRYSHDNQTLLRTQNVTSETNQIDEYSRSHSLIVEENWIVSPNKVNTFRLHYVHDYGNHQLGGNDRNLPMSGPISASNPRPVRRSRR
jgi:hypothetical protein